jgi:pimeloyl-ACP methyl ester carboxylesterase
MREAVAVRTVRGISTIVGAVIALLGAGQALFASGALADTITVTPRTLTVPAPGPGTLHVAATMFERAAATPKTAILLVPGLSYGQWAWDFPYNSHQYSVARPLAAAGYVALAIDLPGYGASDHPGGGHSDTVEYYARVVASIGRQLRRMGFAKVVVIGHSAGSEVAELAAIFHPRVFDALVATGYTHQPSVGLVSEFYTGDVPRSLLSGYEYFEGTPAGRAAAFYTGSFDPAVPPIDNAMANLTPSGEILSIGTPPQPSRLLIATIRVPVLLVVGDKDSLFPLANDPVPLLNNVQLELLQFTGSRDKSAIIAHDAGHLFFLERSAPQTLAEELAWLDARLPH